MNAHSAILETGKSPAEWCGALKARGFDVSERTLRSKARELGACHVIGKAMIITPEQIDAILEDCLCPSKHSRPNREASAMTPTTQSLEQLAVALLDTHIQRCRDAVDKCPVWSPAQAEWSRTLDALLNFRDDLAALRTQQEIPNDK